VIEGWVEVSQESLSLAQAEVVAAAEAVGGSALRSDPLLPELVAVEVPSEQSWAMLAKRLALARRCLVVRSDHDSLEAAAAREGRRGGSAAFRRIGAPSGGGVDTAVLDCGRAYTSAGGRIDLVHPARRYWLVRDSRDADLLLEEVASVDRSGPAQRVMPSLPFRRPVSLPPRLARAAANLARVSPGQRVLDPFLGTGALLAEAGLLGARLYGIDRDPAMVRGALRNLSHLGVTAEALVVGDARQVEFDDPSIVFGAIVTDPPYGRSSSTGGEASVDLVHEVVDRWWPRVAPGGRLTLIVPSGRDLPDIDGTLRVRVPVRVHRSLTREFCVYERANVSRS